jgi:integrase/recombinase XerC
MVPKMTPAIEVLAPLAPSEGPFSPIIAGTSWEAVLTAYLNAAVDSPNTVRAYRRHCTMACQRMGIATLAELNGAMLAAYRAEVAGNPALGPASQALALYAVRSFLKWAGILGAHALNQQVLEVSLRPPRATVRNPYMILTADETTRLWQAAATRPNRYALICICLGAGLRISEIAALLVQDCYQDLEGGPAIRVYQGKGGKDRTVPMLPEFFQGITAYLEATGRDLTSSGRVFAAEDQARAFRGQGARISTPALSFMLKRILAGAGIESHRVGVHALRHTYAIGVLRESKNLTVVQKLLGHSSVTTTSRYVDHLQIGELRDALPKNGPATQP